MDFFYFLCLYFVMVKFHSNLVYFEKLKTSYEKSKKLYPKKKKLKKYFFKKIILIKKMKQTES